MNELYVADPACFQSVGDLRYLFGLFGPQTGRYLAAYPANWKDQILRQLSDLPELKQEQIKVLFRRAWEDMIYLSDPSLPWKCNQEWVLNALNIKQMTPPRVHGVIGIGDHKGVLSFDDLTLPISSGEPIEAKPEEYVRVTRTLIANSGELFFIDPFLNPRRKDVREVLEALLKTAALLNKCQSVVCYARASHVISSRGFSWDELVSAWKSLLSDIRWQPKRRFRYILIDDEASYTKMHGRYLFSLQGSIRLEQGFQKLPRGRKVDISPVAKAVHEDLLKTYLEGKHDMQRMHELTF
jgi:hypothetical protein